MSFAIFSPFPFSPSIICLPFCFSPGLIYHAIFASFLSSSSFSVCCSRHKESPGSQFSHLSPMTAKQQNGRSTLDSASLSHRYPVSLLLYLKKIFKKIYRHQLRILKEGKILSGLCGWIWQWDFINPSGTNDLLFIIWGRAKANETTATVYE